MKLGRSWHLAFGISGGEYSSFTFLLLIFLLTLSNYFSPGIHSFFPLALYATCILMAVVLTTVITWSRKNFTCDGRAGPDTLSCSILSLLITSVFKRKVALLGRKLAYTSVSCDGENSLGPPFLSQWKRKTVVQSLGCCRAGLNLWMTVLFRFIYLSGFGEEEGSPVKGDLANFEGFYCIRPSVHAALGERSRVLMELRLLIAGLEYCGISWGSVSLTVGWACGIFPFWNIIYQCLCDPLIFCSFMSM